MAASVTRIVCLGWQTGGAILSAVGNAMMTAETLDEPYRYQFGPIAVETAPHGGGAVETTSQDSVTALHARLREAYRHRTHGHRRMVDSTLVDQLMALEALVAWVRETPSIPATELASRFEAIYAEVYRRSYPS